MIIYIDIDQTLNDLVPKALELYNKRTGENINMSDITTYSFYQCLPEKQAGGLFALFEEQELWDSLEPLPDSQWGVETLVNLGHEVYIATATYDEEFPQKCDWMHKWFPMIDSKHIIRICNKGLLKGDILIDDCLDNLISSSCERICLDYPYNRNEAKDDIYEIYRAYNWKGIVKYVKEIERKMREWEK
jgi:5'(3')-deoxyribonucleotidase